MSIYEMMVGGRFLTKNLGEGKVGEEGDEGIFLNILFKWVFEY